MNTVRSDDATIAGLVGRAVQGDAEALSSLLSLFGPRIERGLKIGRTWRHAIDPSDVMQVTYLEVFMQIGRFRPEQAASFEAWLGRIAENNLRDAIRGLDRQKHPPPNRRIRPNASDDEPFAELYDALRATSSTPSRTVARQDLGRLIQEALARLPADYARSVQLYDLECRPIAEVAAALGKSPGAVHMIRARAHERLGELLETTGAWFSVSV